MNSSSIALAAVPIVRSPRATQGQVVVEGLGKRYETTKRKGWFRTERVSVEALADVSFEIAPGEVFGLLGPNGAGKTTLIKCLTTLLVPSSGRAWVNGHLLTRDDARIRAGIGCMLMGERGLYWKLTARENLRFFGALHHLRPEEARARGEPLLERFGLAEIADRAVETYSSGQRMKLSFAKALINDAPLLFLDEPTNTLDPASARELRAAVQQLRREGRTIIYTTHIMSEAETLCDRVAVIDRGRMLALGTVEELKESQRGEEIVHITGIIPQAAGDAVRALACVREAAWVPGSDGWGRLTVVARARGERILPELITTLVAHGTVVQQVSPEEVTLEDVFIAHTGRSLAEGGAR